MMRRRPSLRILAGFVLLWSVLYGLGRTGKTSIDHGVATAAVIAVCAIVVEANLLGTSIARAPAQLGLGRPALRSMIAASVVSLIVVAPVAAYVVVAGAPVELRDGWPLLLLGLFAYHGIAEELCWRGYAFGHLRRTRSFGAAMVATTPLIAATHVPVILESGLAVGAAGMIIAAATCLPLGYLYELGGRTIWPAALVHAAIDSFKLVEDPAGSPGLTMVVAVAGLVCPFAIFAWRRPAGSSRPARTSRADAPVLAAAGGARS